MKLLSYIWLILWIALPVVVPMSEVVVLIDFVGKQYPNDGV